MTGFTCQEGNCKEDVYSLVAFKKKYLCLKHVKELGDFDQFGRLDDHRHDKQRQEYKRMSSKEAALA